MGNEALVLTLLESALRTTLGERYIINRELPPSASGNSKTHPDLTVWSQDEPRNLYIIELKQSGGSFDLPLSVANQTKRIKEENRALNPTLILATTSRIGNLLRMELEDQQVVIVKSEAPTNLADDISRIIRMNQASVALN